MLNPEPVALYGLFDPSGCCRYVGQSICPKQRLEDHNHFEKGIGRGLSFTILAWVESDDADRTETNLITAYREKGQADLNKRLKGFSNSRNKNNSCVILWIETGRVFKGMNEAARFFQCSPQTIANAIKLYGGKLIGTPLTTLKRLTAAVRENGKKGGRPKKEEGKMKKWLCREHGFINELQSLLNEGWPRCPHCGDICDKVVGDSILTYASSVVRKTSDSMAFEKAMGMKKEGEK